ncbi:MAG: CRISPR-associated protein Cmr2 [Candidatus Sumerlaeota bacterium]|nr:CRISPR-associated protein Cmr2 [Candidatus Sumerlaeota bacterium]
MPKEFRFSFSLGPVQSAIQQARSVRDLWTGSYLIAWLTARAAAMALDKGAEFDDPQWADSVLVKFHRTGKAIGLDADRLRRSSLPNTFQFTASGDEESAAKLAAAVEYAVHAEWRGIVQAVHDELAKAGLPGSWDAGWREQTDHVWTVRVDRLEVGPHLRDAARALGCGDEALLANEARLAGELLGRAGAAAKLLRPLRPHGGKDDTRPKCSITGEDAQMGPVGLSLGEFAAFWSGPMAKAVTDAGERLREGEHLGAPALVKRLAWACSLSRRLRQDPGGLRTTDTATIAAGPWLAKLRLADPPIPDEHEYLHEWARVNHKAWSGQWLHRDKDEERAPDAVDAVIKDARNRHGAPPAYYAAMMMDGDRMGERLRHCSPEQYRDFTTLLSRFSLDNVPDLIQDYLQGPDGLGFNQPVYAGGDDVLALLPMWMPKQGEQLPHQSAVGLAHAIQQAFGALGLPGSNDPATMSAGIAIVHYKTDLREALDAARSAEKAAKNGGRNRAALTVMRRSGEHVTVPLPWSHVAVFEELVAAFADGASDRWAYRLRQVLDGLTTPLDERHKPAPETFVDLIDAECARILGHAEGAREHRDLFVRAWDTFSHRGNGTPNTERAELQRNALTLIQSASFMARGREEAR